MNEEYLLRSHPRNLLRQWAAELKYFRFFRAYGGHANDGDSLVVALRYNNLSDLKMLSRALGITLRELHPDSPKPVPGKAYSFRQFSVFRNEIRHYPGFEQPERQTISGEEVFVWCEQSKMKISILCRGDGGYSVTMGDVESAKRIEGSLAPFAERIIDPPEDTDHYLCPKYHPGFFTAQGG